MSATDNGDAERQNLAAQLKIMNEMFFASLNEPLLGWRQNSAESTFFEATTPDMVSNINKLFKNHVVDDALFALATPPTAETIVYVKTKSNVAAYSGVTLANSLTDMRNKVFASGDEQVMDVNVHHLASDDCKKMMDALYAWHDLCNDDKWDLYMNGGDVNLKKAALTNSRTNAIEAISKATPVTTGFKADMNSYLNFSKMERSTSVDRFMVQRMVYVYIRMLQFQIAMRVANTDLDKKEWSLAATIIGILERDIGDVATVIKRIDDLVVSQKKEYQKLNDNISNLHDTIDTHKTNIKTQVERVGTESRYESKGKSMMTAALAILITVVVGTILVFVLPLDKPKRMMGAAAVLTVASLSALIMSIVFSKVVVEGFTSNYAFVDSTLGDNIVRGISFANGNILFSGEMRRKVLEYLQHCTMLVNGVKSYQILGNINYTMSKENRYFNDMSGQMTIAGERIKGTHRTSDLVQKQYSSSMYFFISLSIIIGASLLSLVAFDEAPMARLITLCVAGFFVVLAVVIFVMEFSSYVRTDGDKKYWSQPPNTGVMMTT